MIENSAYPAAPSADVAFLGDAVDARFVKAGDVIERGGACITVSGVTRFDAEGVTAFSYLNESGGIQAATIPHGVMVELGTLL